MLTEHFTIFHKHRDGNLNRRFFKIAYTAALRLGIQTDLNQDKIEIRFRGTLDHSIQAHQDNMAFRGEITVEGKSTPDVIVILREGHHGRYQLISFWPDTQHPDAHKSYTDPLVDTALAGSPYDIQTVATVMHDCFKNNAGVSPAALMQKLYQERVHELSASQAETAQQLQEIAADLVTAKEQAEEFQRKLLEKDKELQSTHTTIELQKIQNQQSQSQIQELIATNAKLENEIESIKSAIDHSTPANASYPEVKAMVTRKAEPVTKVWNSRTGSNYKNVGVLGWVIDVEQVGNKIELTTLNTQGQKMTLTDFGRFGFVSHVFDYLIERKDEAAVFIITWRPNGSPMLASDTMMLPQYRHLWASLK